MLAWVAQWGYLGLFAVLFVEEAGVPIPVPGDVFIAAIGAAGHAGAASFGLTVAVVAAATVSGSAILFELSRRMGHPLLLRVGRRFGFDADRAARTDRWLQRRGAAAIVLGRLTPGLRIVLTGAAGALRMPRRTFTIGTAVASVIWATLYYWLGFVLGAGAAGVLRRAAGRALQDPDAVAVLVIAAVPGAAGVAGTLLWRRKRARRLRPRPPAVPSPGDDA